MLKKLRLLRRLWVSRVTALCFSSFACLVSDFTPSLSSLITKFCVANSFFTASTESWAKFKLASSSLFFSSRLLCFCFRSSISLMQFKALSSLLSDYGEPVRSVLTAVTCFTFVIAGLRAFFFGWIESSLVVDCSSDILPMYWVLSEITHCISVERVTVRPTSPKASPSPRHWLRSLQLVECLQFAAGDRKCVKCCVTSCLQIFSVNFLIWHRMRFIAQWNFVFYLNSFTHGISFEGFLKSALHVCSLKPAVNGRI